MALFPNALRAAGLGWGADWIRMLRGGRGGGGGGGSAKKSDQERNVDLLNKGAYGQKFSMNLADEKLPYSTDDDTMPTVGFDTDTMRPSFGTVDLSNLND